jgi:RNA polymerase sigma factor (sigma-70 family)
MNTLDDSELLRRYACEREETAFAELVRRHVNLVFAAALRRVGGDAHLAQDVTQQVFCDLARRADRVTGHTVLSGWLHTSTRYAAAHAVRAEQRRRVREQAAFTMNATQDSAGPGDERGQLRPVLDAAIDRLDAADRAAVVLRFFEGRSFAEIGKRLQLTENAARMRVERALEKLHRLLAQRGIRSTAAALGLALQVEAGVIAPVGLAGSVTAAALTTGAVATGSGAWASFMSMTKLQVGLAGALAVATVSGVVWQAQALSTVRAEVEELRRQSADTTTLETENIRLARLIAEAEQMRNDDAELGRLQDEVGVLRKRLQAIAEAEVKRAAQLASTVHEVTTLDKRPTPVFQTRPSYPSDMRAKGLSGVVIVEFVVDRAGDVWNAKAVTSTREEFASAAVEAVLKWKFRPGEKSGVPVPTRMKVPLSFAIAGQNVPAGKEDSPEWRAVSDLEQSNASPFITYTKP